MRTKNLAQNAREIQSKQRLANQNRREFIANSSKMLAFGAVAMSASLISNAASANSSAASVGGNLAATPQIPNAKLNNGVLMPLLGFGTLDLPREQCAQSVFEAIKAGYRLIDTAQNYINEDEVGAGIKEAIKSGLVKRDELFITTKLWINDYQNANKAFETSLKRLGVDYLDLYLLHQPFNDIYGAWRVLSSLYKAKRVRAIGVSNFYPDRLADLCLNNEIKPMVNQIEISPYFQQESARAINAKYGVQVEAWGALVRGKNANLFKEASLVKIARTHKKSVAQVVLRWLLQREIVSIVKTQNPQRMRENLGVLDFALSQNEMQTIAKLDTGKTSHFEHRNADGVEFLITKATRKR